MQKGSYREFRDLCNHPQRLCWAVAQQNETRNLCPISWKMWASFKPPMIAISLAPARFTHNLIAGSKELVLAWPGRDLAEATLTCGSTSGRKVDKFESCDLATVPATHVAAPLIRDAVANLECRVVSRTAAGDHTIFTAKILEFWINPEAGPVLCQIGEEAGYHFIAQRGMYRLGIIE